MENNEIAANEIPPFTPVRSSSDNSGLLSYDSTIQNDHGSVASSVRSGQQYVQQSPQRSLQNTSSVNSSPCSVNRSAANLSPIPTRRTPSHPNSAAPPMQPELGGTPQFTSSQPQHPPPMQPELNTPSNQTPFDVNTPSNQTPFGENNTDVGDLLGDFTHIPGTAEPQDRSQYTPQQITANPRVLYASDDEDTTDPSSSIGGNEHVGYTRNDATSTFGKNIQSLKDKMTPKKRTGSEEEEGALNKGALISGYLQKQGRNGKWQTRWFESDGESLTYFKSSKRKQKLATLDLAQVGTIRVNPQDPSGCTFTINISQRPYQLQADSKESCKDWVITLNRVKEARLHQGNVKLNTQIPDLLDDTAAPRVVVVSGRQRLHAVDDINHWESTGYANPAAGDEEAEDYNKQTFAKWQKSKRKITKLASKVLRWARSIRKFGCTAADSQVVLDHHVHPPGHDDYRGKSSANTKTAMPREVSKETAFQNEGVQMAETPIASNATNNEMPRDRAESLDFSRAIL